MLYYNFYGYEGFKSCFGLEKRDNGTVVRKNKILLGHLKNTALLKYCREHDNYDLLRMHDMADLQKKWLRPLPNQEKKMKSCLIK